MTDLTHWFLTSILGPLMLPLFALATLCMIAGARPEPIVAGFVSLVASVIVGLFRLLITIISAIFHVPAARKSYPPPRRYPPKPKPDDSREPS
jgi:hypothetical protein